MTSLDTLICSPNNNGRGVSYYEKLGFSSIENNIKNLYSDGTFIIELSDSNFVRPSLKLYKETWKSEFSKIKTLSKFVVLEDSLLVCSPSGAWVYLIEKTEVHNFILPEQEPSVIGKFAGFSFESIDIEASIKFWKLLGFDLSMGSAAQGWVSLKGQDGVTISIMKPNTCPHLFFSPSLTFFNGKNNLAIIEKVRSLDIPIKQEITVFNEKGIVDNIILQDPGGLGMFVFND